MVLTAVGFGLAAILQAFMIYGSVWACLLTGGIALLACIIALVAARRMIKSQK